MHISLGVEFLMKIWFQHTKDMAKNTIKTCFFSSSRMVKHWDLTITLVILIIKHRQKWGVDHEDC